MVGHNPAMFGFYRIYGSGDTMFLIWPRDSNSTKPYSWERLKVSHHPTKCHILQD